MPWRRHYRRSELIQNSLEQIYSILCILSMLMKPIIKGITTLVVFSTLALCQFRSDVPTQTIPVNSRGLSHAQGLSMLDLNRFSMNHSFGMSMMSSGGQSMSVGAYTNQMDYMLRDNLRLSTQFSLSSPMGGVNPYAKNGFGGSQLYYGASLDYQPLENLSVKFSMDNYPRYGFARPYSRLYHKR